MTQEKRSFVFVRRGPPPPSICFLCGTTDGLEIVSRHFYTTPDESTAVEVADAAVSALGALGEVASVGLGLVRLIRGTREANVPIPLCAACSARWARSKRAERLRMVPAYAALAAFMIVAFTHGPGPLLPSDATTKWAFLAAAVPLAYLLFRFVPELIDRKLVHPGTCQVVAIAPEWVAVTRVHPKACAALIVARGRGV